MYMYLHEYRQAEKQTLFIVAWRCGARAVDSAWARHFYYDPSWLAS